MNREKWFRALNAGHWLRSLRPSTSECWLYERSGGLRTVSRKTLRSRARGFSLLELMIVLVTMAGILALVWPNLSKPLESSAVRESAQIVRDAIDGARYQAAVEGEIQFVRFQSGSAEITSGALASFLSELELDSAINELPHRNEASHSQRGLDTSMQSGSSAFDVAEPTARAPRVWQLSPDVIVLDVQWTTSPHLPDAVSSMVEGDRRRHETTMPPAGGGAVNQSTDSPWIGVDAESRVWWLPLSPLGGGKDASIFLMDARTRKTISIRFESATGSLEIVQE